MSFVNLFATCIYFGKVSVKNCKIFHSCLVSVNCSLHILNSSPLSYISVTNFVVLVLDGGRFVLCMIVSDFPLFIILEFCQASGVYGMFSTFSYQLCCW